MPKQKIEEMHSQFIHYINRKGKTYYLHAATTKAGCTRYVMTRLAAGALTEFPKGYVITENVNGMVSVMRSRPRLITEAEEAMVIAGLKKLGLDQYRVAVKGAYITIYESIHVEEDELPWRGVLQETIKEIIAKMISKGPFDPVMQFHIEDQEKRFFDVERMTYRGRGGWLSLHRHGTLLELINTYFKHLGKDSFYDLM
jgi:hypothetical protein